jgi:hypothetical protein
MHRIPMVEQSVIGLARLLDDATICHVHRGTGMP